MLRKLNAAALALAMAGGVYFAASPADASNMGFKLERDFATYPNWKAAYWVSFPLFNGLGDVAHSTMAPGNKCDLSLAPTPGMGDGVINFDDALCDLFTDVGMITNGNMSIQQLDANCVFVGRVMRKSPIGGISFVGTAVDMIANREYGWYVQPFVAAGQPDITNRAVIVGSHDPSFGGHTVSAALCLSDYINLPYHTQYTKAAEILCGLEGMDWMDADMNGLPDTCPAGVYDPATGVRVVIQTHVNDPAPPSPLSRGFNGLAVDRNPFNMMTRFVGVNFSLTPGDAYIVSLVPTFTGTRNWISPHF